MDDDQLFFWRRDTVDSVSSSLECLERLRASRMNTDEQVRVPRIADTQRLLAVFDPRWSRDNRDLFYLSASGDLTVTEFPRSDLEPGRTTSLFSTGITPTDYPNGES